MKATMILLALGFSLAPGLAAELRPLAPPTTGGGPSGAAIHSPALTDSGGVLWFVAERPPSGGGPGLYRLDTAGGGVRLVVPGRILAYAVAESGGAVAVELEDDRPDLGDTNGVPDIYHHSPGLGTLKLASRRLSAPLAGRNLPARNPRISRDGSLVLFDSAARDLAPQNANYESDLFLYHAGADSLSLVSASGTNPDSTAATGAYDGFFALGDGAVLYSTTAPVLTPDENRSPDMLLRAIGSAEPPVFANADPSGEKLPSCCEGPSVSPGGRFVAFRSGTPARNLHLKDLGTGELTPIPGPHYGVQSPGTNIFRSSISSDGTRLTMLHTVPTPRSTRLVLKVFDRPTGREIQVVPSAEPVNEESGGPRSFVPRWAWLSPDGKHLFFTASQRQVCCSEAYPEPLDLFHMEVDGPELTLPQFLEERRVSRSWPGVADPGWLGAVAVAESSGTGFVAAWESAGPDGRSSDIYWTPVPATEAPRSLRALLDAQAPSSTHPGHTLLAAKPLDDSGRWLAIESDRSFGGAARHPSRQIHLLDMENGGMTLVSAARDGGAGSGPSRTASISADGNAIAFFSLSTNLLEAPVEKSEFALYLRDRAASKTELIMAREPHPGGGLAHYLPVRAALSADAGKVAVTAQAVPYPSQSLFLWDRATANHRLVSWTSNPETRGYISESPPQISRDGVWVLFHTTATDVQPLNHRGSRLHHTGDGTFRAIVDPNNSPQGLLPARVAFDASGSKILLTTTPGVAARVYLYDVPTGQLRPVATNCVAAGIAPNGLHAYVVSQPTPNIPKLDVVSLEGESRASFVLGGPDATRYRSYGNPSFSANGDWIAFASGINHAESGDTNNALDIFIGHRPTGALRRLASFQGLAASHPVLSTDGRFVVFHAMGDFGEDRNGSIDIFMAPVAGEAVDSDGDGMDDAWEIAHFDTLAANPGEDPDGDGMTNLQEFLAGTNPRDGSSLLALRAFQSLTTGAVHLVWPSAPGVRYQVEARETLEGSPWTALGAAASHPGATATLIDANPPATTRFYRVRVAP